MINKKNNQKQSYKKSSTLFMQLGLILALFISYSALETEMNYKLPEIAISDPIDNPDEQNIDEIDIIKDKPIKQPKKIQPKEIEKPIKVEPKVVDEVKVVKNHVKVKPTKLASSEATEKTEIKPVKISAPIKTKVNKAPTTLSSAVVQEMPTFPGCKGSFDEKKACFESKIRKHILKHFDNDLAHNLDLNEGKQRIRVEFIVDEHGNVADIKARAVHKNLEKEATRIIKKLPKMTPGKQNKKTVRVRYNVPINFQVEY